MKKIHLLTPGPTPVAERILDGHRGDLSVRGDQNNDVGVGYQVAVLLVVVSDGDPDAFLVGKNPLDGQAHVRAMLSDLDVLKFLQLHSYYLLQTLTDSFVASHNETSLSLSARFLTLYHNAHIYNLPERKL